MNGSSSGEKSFFTAEGDKQIHTSAHNAKNSPRTNSSGYVMPVQVTNQRIFIPSVPAKIPINQMILDADLGSDKSRASRLIKQLVIRQEHLTNSYMRSSDAVKHTECELEEQKNISNELAYNLQSQELKCQHVEGELQRSQNRVASLEAINEELYIAKGELERKCVKAAISETVHFILTSKSATLTSIKQSENLDVPSFDLNVTQLDSNLKEENQDSDGAVTVIGADGKVCDVPKEHEKMRSALEVV